MKKIITSVFFLALSAGVLLTSSCKKSSDTPTPTTPFTNDAAFLAGTYSVSERGVTPSSAPITYSVTITASTTVNGSFTINNFANGGTSVNVSGTYNSSGNLITVTGGTEIGGGKKLGASGSTLTTSPVKMTVDYYYSLGITSNDESFATYTRN